MPLFVVSGARLRDDFHDHVHLCEDCLRTAVCVAVTISGTVRAGEVMFRPPLRWVQVDPDELYERKSWPAPTGETDESFQQRVGLQGWVLEDADGQVLLAVDGGWGSPELAGDPRGPVADLLARAGDIPALEERIAALTRELRQRRWPRVFRGELPAGVTGVVLDDDARNGLLADAQDALADATEQEAQLRARLATVTAERDKAREWARHLWTTALSAYTRYPDRVNRHVPAWLEDEALRDADRAELAGSSLHPWSAVLTADDRDDMD